MNVTPWAWATLLVYLVGVGLAFGLRTWTQIRRTGTSGFRGASGRPGSVEWWGGALFPIGLLVALAAPVLALTGTAPPIAAFARPAVAVVGGVIAVGGLVLVLLAQRDMGGSWRIGVDAGERTDLVTHGLFRRIRNPIFTGMAAVTVGGGLMVPSVVAATAVLLALTSVQIQVRVVEEPYLRRVHGRPYERYAATAGRFLPGIGRLPG